ncbi:hypothetical protein V8G54_003549 [Vigna mungo]|uniref:TF-B3 domain-containing protein n=1 Tax=Vigna mungo TaxID=3915 RepID=A0AAQ3PAN0_VIGMU
MVPSSSTGPSTILWDFGTIHLTDLDFGYVDRHFASTTIPESSLFVVKLTKSQCQGSHLDLQSTFGNLMRNKGFTERLGIQQSLEKGWKEFCTQYDLKEGDVVVFENIQCFDQLPMMEVALMMLLQQEMLSKVEVLLGGEANLERESKKKSRERHFLDFELCPQCKGASGGEEEAPERSKRKEKRRRREVREKRRCAQRNPPINVERCDFVSDGGNSIELFSLTWGASFSRIFNPKF